MIPQHDHPLTLAYIASVRAKSHDQMREAARLIAALEQLCSDTVRAQCKLAAEVTLERTQRNPVFHPHP